MSGCNITRLAHANIGDDLVQAHTSLAKKLLDEQSLHCVDDVALAVAPFIHDADIDAFIIVASEVSMNYGPRNLLALDAIRKWAEHYRPVLLTE